MFGFFVAIISVLGVMLATFLMISGIRVASVGPETYKLVQRYKNNDYILDLWIDYLRCKIDKVTLRDEIVKYLQELETE